MISSRLLTLFALTWALMLGTVVFGQPADTVYHNGSILTMTGKEPTYVEALAVKEGVTTIHTQFMRKDHIPKFVQYNVRPSFYTLHTYYFAEAHLANRGQEQAMYISPMRDAIDAGLRPSNHTDFVVAPLDTNDDALGRRESCLTRRSRNGP